MTSTRLCLRWQNTLLNGIPIPLFLGQYPIRLPPPSAEPRRLLTSLFAFRATTPAHRLCPLPANKANDIVTNWTKMTTIKSPRWARPRTHVLQNYSTIAPMQPLHYPRPAGWGTGKTVTKSKFRANTNGSIKKVNTLGWCLRKYFQTAL